MNETTSRRKNQLTKFDSTFWLCVGIVISLLLISFNIWSIIVDVHDSFVPIQVGRILGIAVGFVLGIHCFDMIGYYRKNGRLK